jgi:hypothetical protein
MPRALAAGAVESQIGFILSMVLDLYEACHAFC